MSAPSSAPSAATGDEPGPENMSVEMPAVATTRDDGLPQTLQQGQFDLSLPVLLAAGQAPRTASLVLTGAVGSCEPLMLEAEHISHLTCSGHPRQGARTVSVALVAGGQQYANWQHDVS